MFLDIKELSPVECYQALVAAVVPRPIAWVSTRSEAGVSNLAPFSFFTVASCQPPVLCVTHVLPRTLKLKDTLVNLHETGECVVNVVDQQVVEQMSATSATFAADVDEFEQIGVERAVSTMVAVDGVALSPVRFECKLREVITISDQPMGGSMILLDIIAIHVNDRCIADGVIDTTLVNAIGKLSGSLYSSSDTVFDINRPS
jgi:flavin reductase (DIM6/NTAB) family NADH-FMN oxidoreductase RutF